MSHKKEVETNPKSVELIPLVFSS